jgi:predicted dehydrogenase
LVLDRVTSTPSATFAFPREQGHDGEVRRYFAEFLREIRTGQPSSSTAFDAARTVAVGEAIKQSVASGQPVSPQRFTS